MDYIDGREQAAMIRRVLKTAFPTVKFSVRLERYAGGSSIDVTWTDGPPVAQVTPLTAPFAGEGFDGMIDLRYATASYLTPDGRAHFGPTKGTGENGGSDPARYPDPPPNARLVQFDADHVFCHRQYSDTTLHAQANTYVRAHLTGATESHYQDLAWRMIGALDLLNGDSMDAAFRRVVLRES